MIPPGYDEMQPRNAYGTSTRLIIIAGAAALGCVVALVLGHFVAASTLCITALAFGAVAADR